MRFNNCSLGFWLEQTGKKLSISPAIAYCGLDRVTEIPFPASVLDEFGVEDIESVISGTRGQLDVAIESGALNADLQLALEFQARFREEGISTEVIHARLVEVPSISESDADLAARLYRELEARAWISEAVAPALAGIRTEFLGLDVTDPVPSFHSAIYQGNLGAVDENFWMGLNEFGLFSDEASASTAAALVNVTATSRLPFCPVAIERVHLDTD